ncbi:Down syndrome critical region protein 3 [Glycine soja]
MSVELKLSRSNRIYRPSEALEGKIIVKTQSSISHYGIRLTVKGSVNLQVRGGSAGVVESFYGVIKPIPIVNRTIEVKSSGKIGSGTSEYLATVDISRGYLHKSLSATMEFIVESDKENSADLQQQPLSPEMAIFYITQDTQRHPLLPELKSGGFRVTGKISTQCSLSGPISGELTVETSAVPIHSIDIQLFRVESVLLGEKIVTETSLVQTTQASDAIADGDVCRNLTLPIYVILPRLLTCPTTLAGPFSVEFKVAIVISFQSELSKLHKKSDAKTPRLWLAMETLLLELVRTK